MPAIKGTNKEAQKKLIAHMSNMTLKAKKAVSPLLKRSGPGVRKPVAKVAPVISKIKESPRTENAKNESSKET